MNQYLRYVDDVDKDKIKFNDIIDMMEFQQKEQRLERGQFLQEQDRQFKRDAQIIKLMIDNHKNADSNAMKERSAEAMRRYWDSINPEFYPVLEPIVTGSPLDAQVEKEEFWQKNGQKMLPIPIKQSEETEATFNSRYASTKYHNYLVGRSKMVYDDINPGPLLEVLPDGVGDDGDMRYIVKSTGLPARLMTAKGMRHAEIEKEKKMLPGTLSQNPEIVESDERVNHGGAVQRVRKVRNLLTNKTEIRVDAIPGLEEDREEQEKRAGINDFINAVSVSMDPVDVDSDMIEKHPGLAKYNTLASEIKSYIDLPMSLNNWFGIGVKSPEAGRKFIRRRMRELYPDWNFNIVWGEAPNLDFPFGRGTRFSAAPGQLYGIKDEDNNYQKFSISDGTVYRLNDGMKMGPKAQWENKLGNEFVPWSILYQEGLVDKVEIK